MCEDFPCCGHEFGDCNGELYGSDESIKEEARKHLNCEHESGIYECEGLDNDYDEYDYEDETYDDYEVVQ